MRLLDNHRQTTNDLSLNFNHHKDNISHRLSQGQSITITGRLSQLILTGHTLNRRILSHSNTTLKRRLLSLNRISSLRNRLIQQLRTLRLQRSRIRQDLTAFRNHQRLATHIQALNSATNNLALQAAFATALTNLDNLQPKNQSRIVRLRHRIDWPPQPSPNK